MKHQTVSRRKVLAMLGAASGALAASAAAFADGGGNSVVQSVYGPGGEACSGKVRVYETVAAMKLDLSLNDGDYALTQGYYEVNDGGGAPYCIADTGEELLDNGRMAQLLIEDTVNLRMFGCKLDYATDDWAPFNKALHYCRDHFLHHITVTGSEGILLSAPLLLDIPGLILENLGYKTCVISPTQEMNTLIVVKANIIMKNFIVHGLKTCVDNISLENGKDSIFENVETRSAKRFGLVSQAVGNNNSVKLTNFRAFSNGTLYDTTCSYISENASSNDTVVEIQGLDFLTGYCRETRYVKIFDDIYILKEIVNATTVKLYPRLPSSSFTAQPISLYCGAGIEIKKHSDNGIWLGNFVACVSNIGAGVRIASLYGHQFNDFSSEFNRVAGLSFGDRLSGSSQSYSNIFIKPYFENAAMYNYDVIAEKCSGFTIIEPILNVDNIKTYTTSLSVKNMTIIRNAHQYKYIQSLTSLSTTHSLAMNQEYTVHTAATGNLTVQLPPASLKWHKQTIVLHLGRLSGDLIVHAASGESVQGMSSYTVSSAGYRMVTLIVVQNGQWALL